MSTSPWPTKINLSKDGRELTVEFDNGRNLVFSAEFLRVMSPSAEVQGHSPDQRKVIGGKIDVSIIGIDPVGNYAVKLTFDDLHDTGIFTWSYFLEMDDQREFLWDRYLRELSEQNLAREM